MAKGTQIENPAISSGLSEEDRYRNASDAVNHAVSSVMELEVQLRQARADERRARAALARIPMPKRES